MILLSIASQTYHQMFSRQALLASSKDAYQFLTLAKSHAIKYNHKVYVYFCPKGNSGEWIMAQSDQNSCDCSVQNSCLVNGIEFNQPLTDGKLVFTSSTNITFTGLKASYNAMRFSVNAGTILLNDNYGNRLKVIQSAMRLRICSPDSDQLGYKKC